MRHIDLLHGVKELERISEGMWGTKALRAVVEFHKPMLWKNLDNDTSGYQCQGCTWGLYPCPTIQAIERGFGCDDSNTSSAE